MVLVSFIFPASAIEGDMRAKLTLLILMLVAWTCFLDSTCNAKKKGGGGMMIMMMGGGGSCGGGSSCGGGGGKL